jgi:hypothetical protein
LEPRTNADERKNHAALAAVFGGSSNQLSRAAPELRHLQNLLEGFSRINAASLCLAGELCYIDSAVRHFAVVNPRLRLPHLGPQLPLGHPCFFTHGSVENRK